MPVRRWVSVQILISSDALFSETLRENMKSLSSFRRLARNALALTVYLKRRRKIILQNCSHSQMQMKPNPLRKLRYYMLRL